MLKFSSLFTLPLLLSLSFCGGSNIQPTIAPPASSAVSSTAAQKPAVASPTSSNKVPTLPPTTASALQGYTGDSWKLLAPSSFSKKDTPDFALMLQDDVSKTRVLLDIEETTQTLVVYLYVNLKELEANGYTTTALNNVKFGGLDGAYLEFTKGAVKVMQWTAVDSHMQAYSLGCGGLASEAATFTPVCQAIADSLVITETAKATPPAAPAPSKP